MRHQQMALDRLQLAVTGLTHSLFYGLYEFVFEQVERNVGQNKRLDDTGYMAIQPSLRWSWENTYQRWIAIFLQARLQAAKLALAYPARAHLYYFGETPYLLEQVAIPTEPAEAGPSAGLPFWRAAQQAAIASWNTNWDDGYNLPGRIWKHAQLGLRLIQERLQQAMLEDADLDALDDVLQRTIGSGPRCAGWCRRQLEQHPETVLEGDPDTGNEGWIPQAESCRATGITNRLLVLSRAEIQAAYHQPMSAILHLVPFFAFVRLRLDPFRREWGCMCEHLEDTAPFGRGVYLRGTLPYPPYHPRCRCRVEPVWIEPAAFMLTWEALQAGDVDDEMAAYLGEWGMGVPNDWITVTPPQGPVRPGDQSQQAWANMSGMAEGYELWSSTDVDQMLVVLDTEELGM